ncbi:MAG: TrkH family potassium uptake protein, partial [Eubacteriales bacterium]|nr:TrkH family potassium uptake protein [Eubacteriales bacterium]
ILCCLVKPDIKTVYAREGIAVVGLAWVIVSLFGALPFWLSGEIPGYIDSLFEIVSGFTTTGSSILTDIEAMSMSNLFWRSFSHWIGGMGVLVFVLALLPQSESHSMFIMRSEVPGPVVGKLVAKTKITARILYAIYIAMTLVEIIMLIAGGMPVFDSVVHSFGTAGTGGFAIKSASIGYYNSAYIDIVIAVFMLLFAVNFNIYYLILIGDARRALRNEELRWYLIIVGASTAAIAINTLHLFGNFGEAVRFSLFQVASIISTTGYATTDFNLWPELSRVILVLLMFIGASAGSTGGGIKVVRVMVMFKTVLRQIKKLIYPRSAVILRIEGKAAGEGVMSGITAFAYAYFIQFALSVLLLSIDTFDPVANFTAVAACINNIGPGLGAVGPAGNFAGFSHLSKCVLIFNMLAGRLELFPIYALFSPSMWLKR